MLPKWYFSSWLWYEHSYFSVSYGMLPAWYLSSWLCYQYAIFQLTSMILGRTALDELNLLLAKLPVSTKIHLEMSSFSEATQLQSIIDNAVFYADSLGMNEQELPNLLSFLRSKRMVQVSDSHPRIAVTLDYMRGIFKILGSTLEENGRRRLSRLHVHTLAYQVIMTVSNSTWKNSMAAAAKSALTANRHTCGSDVIDVSTATLLTDESFAHSARPNNGDRRTRFDPKNPVSCWVEDGIDVCVAPVLVCTRVIQTVGGGDNVSAAGLVLQIWFRILTVFMSVFSEFCWFFYWFLYRLSIKPNLGNITTFLTLSRGEFPYCIVSYWFSITIFGTIRFFYCNFVTSRADLIF